MMTESSAIPVTATTPRLLRYVILVGAVLLLCYVGSPYYSLGRFVEAVKSGDTAALAERVNFPEVRSAMKQQLRAYFFPENEEQKRAKKNRFESMIARLGPNLLDQLVDAYLTPDGLAALIVNPKLASASASPSLPTASSDQIVTRQNVDWSKVRYAFFTSPREFLVDLNGTKLRFRLSGSGWRVHRVELPLGAPAGTG